jgi:hypothetical protein
MGHPIFVALRESIFVDKGPKRCVAEMTRLGDVGENGRALPDAHVRESGHGAPDRCGELGGV